MIKTTLAAIILAALPSVLTAEQYRPSQLERLVVP